MQKANKYTFKKYQLIKKTAVQCVVDERVQIHCKMQNLLKLKIMSNHICSSHKQKAAAAEGKSSPRLAEPGVRAHESQYVHQDMKDKFRI